MNRCGQYGIVVSMVLAGTWWAADDSQAGPGNPEPWQPILTKDVYKELVKREAEKIQQILNGQVDEDGLRRAKLGAVLIIAYTKSVKGAATNDLDGTATLATALDNALRQKDGLDKAKKLAGDLVAGNTKVAKTLIHKNLGGLLEKADLMDHFHTLAKGGDGMHPELQSNIKFKGALNGTEEKLRYLSLKELSPTAMKKEAKELQLLGYRTSVVGALTYLYAPAKKMGAKDPEDWRRFSITMRDSAAELATAAAKGDTAAVFKAGNTLNSSCSQCHGTFRGN